MAKVDLAKALAEKGFYVFPLKVKSKIPAITKFTEKSTRDPKKIEQLWESNPNFNIGIATSKFGDEGESLVVIDVDNKNGKNGFNSLKVFLEDNSLKLPKTYSQKTPTGGKHILFKYKNPVKGTIGFLKGVDIRSEGNLVVGAGSETASGRYTIVKQKNKTESFVVADCPERLAEMIGLPVERIEVEAEKAIDLRSAKARIRTYLKTAPQAIEGDAGDITTYKVIAKVKDFGVSKETAFEMLQRWDENNSPPWGDDLWVKIENAYEYGKKPPGYDAPENDFKQVVAEKQSQDYIEKINETHSLIVGMSKPLIIYQGPDTDAFLSEHSFKTKFANKKIVVGDNKTRKAGDLWIESPRRREYQSFQFLPEKETPDHILNIWRGFKTPALNYVANTKQAQRAYDDFMQHILENLCEERDDYFNWVMDYFAHLIQKPYEKPLTSLVIRGQKGTGKNFIMDRIGRVMGEDYYIVLNSKRFLVGQFNAHLAKKLLVVFDEAFWSGDKGAEGVLKSLITDTKMMVERKGFDPVTESNFMRIVILGNEDWLVPATADERRFTVLQMGNSKRLDTKFFEKTRVGMDNAGGNQILMHYLKNKKITKDINVALETPHLSDQRLLNLDPLQMWWQSCIENSAILPGNDWPDKIGKDDLIDYFNVWAKEKRFNYYMSRTRISRSLAKMCPSLDPRQKLEGKMAYKLPKVEEAEKEWKEYIGLD